MAYDVTRAAGAMTQSGHTQDATVATGTMMLAVAWLRGSVTLPQMAPTVREQLVKYAHRMPEQRIPRLVAHRAHDWLECVSLADYLGDFDLAWALLDEIERLLRADFPRALERDRNVDASTADARNLLAISYARRGRVTRQRGDTDAARDWYLEGLRIVAGAPEEDGWAQCAIGLAACAHLMGNFPEAMRWSTQVLRVSPPPADTEQCSAHHIMAACFRRRGDLAKALGHAWAAYDLVDAEDDRRVQCLIGVSEIALEMGHIDAAENGFQVVLEQPQPERLRIPARIGMLSASVARWTQAITPDVRLVRQRIETLLTEVRACQSPFERANALVAALEGAISIGDTTLAQALAADYSRDRAMVALQAGFHELDYRFERALGAMEQLAVRALPAATKEAQARQDRPKRPTRLAATSDSVIRLAELVDMAGHSRT